MNAEKCLECGKAVYPTERVAADNTVRHKACFRCKKCNNVLKLGSYASMQGEVFCKPCFKKNFFSKGNYSEGFGKLKPQQEHDLKTGKLIEPLGSPSSPSQADVSPLEVPKEAHKERDLSKGSSFVGPTRTEPRAEKSEVSVKDKAASLITSPPEPRALSQSAPQANVGQASPIETTPKDTPKESPKDTPKESPKQLSSSTGSPPVSRCMKCGKSVFKMEELVADEKVFHKTCFRCKKCNNVLKLGSYASMEGNVFCKNCFKKNFFSKGNYSEGFGKLKPQQEHDLKTGKTTEEELRKNFEDKQDNPENDTTKEDTNSDDEAKQKEEEEERRKEEEVRKEAERKQKEIERQKEEKRKEEEAKKEAERKQKEIEKQKEEERKKRAEEEVKKADQLKKQEEEKKKKEEERLRALEEARSKREEAKKQKELEEQRKANELKEAENVKAASQQKQDDSKIQELNRENEDLKSKNKDLNAKITELTSKLESQKKEHETELEKVRSELKTSVDSEELERERQIVSKLKSELETVKRDNESSQSKSANELEEKEHQIIFLTSERDELKTEVNKLKALVETLKANLETQKNEETIEKKEENQSISKAEQNDSPSKSTGDLFVDNQGLLASTADFFGTESKEVPKPIPKAEAKVVEVKKPNDDSTKKGLFDDLDEKGSFNWFDPNASSKGGLFD